MKIIENQTISNRYRIVKPLGQGGFAEVWLAEDLELDNRKVALKFFASERGLDSGGIELFKKEFIRTSELRHPNLLNANHFGVVEHERIPFLEMPYCAGGSLASKVQAGHEFSEREIASILKDVGNGLSYLHEQGVIHRDIKPDNILISEGGRYLISDFGISLRLRSTLTKATQRKGGSSSGTTAFMAPELFRNQPDGSEKTDIFGLGVSIFELCTGILPWQGIGGLALFQGAGAPALQGQYSEQFEKLFQRCLEVDPQLRPTAKKLEHAAEHFLKEGTWYLAQGESKIKEVVKAKSPNKETKAFANVENRVPELATEKSKLKSHLNKKVIWGGSAIVLLISLIVVVLFLREKERMNDLIRRAEKNDVKAQFQLAETYLYNSSWIVSQNVNEGMYWLKKAASRSHGGAQHLIAWFYDVGLNGFERDEAKAVLWYKESIENSLYLPTFLKGANEFALGEHYENGEGVSKNVREAIFWYTEAKQSGYTGAEEALKRLGFE